MPDLPPLGPPWYCPVPACENRPYPTLEVLQMHLEKAQAEGDPNHIDIVIMEGWDEKPLEAT